jgi:hypothetical protein
MSAQIDMGTVMNPRQERLQAAVRLETPDQVPIVLNAMFWVGRHYGGLNCRESMFDYLRVTDAWRRALHELQPDAYMSPFDALAIGPPLEALGLRGLRWPGNGAGEDSPYQYLDQEFMQAGEYDEYLLDPTGFMLRRYLPRVASAYEGLDQIPVSAGTVYLGLVHSAAHYARPEVLRAFERLAAAGRVAEDWLGHMLPFVGEMAAAGFLPDFGVVAHAPYDYFADFMRGSKQAMLDLRRRPEKLLAAMDRMLAIHERTILEAAGHTPCRTVFIPLHWGLDGFMSAAQFQKFFWPPLRELIVRLIGHGLTPLVLWEGDCTTRLELIGDIPRGKAIYAFERTNLELASRVLSGTVCLRGNVPASMFISGTPGEVADCCRRLIDTVGRDGGFIMDGGSGIPNEARADCVRAMFETTRSHGVYRRG